MKVKDQHGPATARARRAVPLSARAVLTVDLSALRANWARLNQASGRAECAGVIKADAYGLGLGPIAKALTNEGCKTFFVASLDEGRTAREVQPGATIYVLDGLLPGAEPHYAGFDLRPCSAASPRCATGPPTAAHAAAPAAAIPSTPASTGSACRTAVEQLAAEPPAGSVRPHAGDEPPGLRRHARQPGQRAAAPALRTLRAKLPPAPASLANSGGLFLGPAYHFDLVRPGIALYGGRAHEGKPNPMQTVVRLAAKILQVRELAPGATIGYGATFRVSRPSRIATIAVGYADGFLRALSVSTGRKPVGFIGDYPCRSSARVSMDFITVDVTDVPRADRRGAWVEVMGDRVTVDDLTDGRHYRLRAAPASARASIASTSKQS